MVFYAQSTMTVISGYDETRALLEGLTLKSVASCGMMPVTRTAGSRGRGISTKLVKLVFSISVSCSKAWSFSICTPQVKH